jgi:hypothetical protein
MSIEECTGTAFSVAVTTSFSDVCSQSHFELIGNSDSIDGREVPEESSVSEQVRWYKGQCLCYQAFGTTINLYETLF